MTSFKRNVLANYIGRSWSALLGLLLIPIYIKFMGVETYGLVGFFTTLSSVLGILDLGIGATMNRELAKRSVTHDLVGTQRDLVRTLEIIYWGIAILVGAIAMIGAPFIANTWIKAEEVNSGSILRAVQLMGISIAFQFPMTLYQGGLMGKQKQMLVNIILIIIGTIRGGGAILVLWLIAPTIQAFFAWQVVISIVGSVTFFIAIWSILPKSAEPAKFKINIISGIWKYAAAISANATIGVIMSQLDKIILSKMLSLKMFAYYTIASTVASSIWMVIIPFNTALFPSLVQLHENDNYEELKKLFHNSSQILSFILLPISAVLIFFSRDILIIWIHDPVVSQNAYLIMSLLVTGIMLNGLVSLPANCAPAFGWPLLITYTNFIQAIFIIPVTIILVNWLNGIGAAIAWIILNSTYIIFMVPLFFRRFLKEERQMWYLQDILAPALAAFFVCFVFRVSAPELNSMICSVAWIVLTGIMSLIITGLILPHVRSIVLDKWRFLLRS